MHMRCEPVCFSSEPPTGTGTLCRVGYGITSSSSSDIGACASTGRCGPGDAAPPAIRHWAGTIGRLLRNGLAVILVCAVLAPAARAFEWCPNDYGPDAYCPDGWACCPYPYGPGYWC